eukprot:SAG25_NODE_270_length_10627_cov_13.114267_3_plen_57_part_00
MATTRGSKPRGSLPTHRRFSVPELKFLSARFSKRSADRNGGAGALAEIVNTTRSSS